MKQLRDLYKDILMLTQLGLSLVMPLLLCLGLCWLLIDKVGLGGWVYTFGFLFGLGGSFTTAYKFYLSIVKRDEEEEKTKKKHISYNRHL